MIYDLLDHYKGAPNSGKWKEEDSALGTLAAFPKYSSPSFIFQWLKSGSGSVVIIAATSEEISEM